MTSTRRAATQLERAMKDAGHRPVNRMPATPMKGNPRVAQAMCVDCRVWFYDTDLIPDCEVNREASAIEAAIVKAELRAEAAADRTVMTWKL